MRALDPILHDGRFAERGDRRLGPGIAFREGAPRTIVTGNTALRNRVDFCDEGVQTVVSGNVFGTTGPCAIVH